MTTITTSTQLCDLLETARTLKTHKADYRQSAHEFSFLDNGTLTTKPQDGLLFGNAMAPARLTEWAMKQAFGRLGKAYKLNGKSLNSLGTDHMKALLADEPDLFALNMNRAIARLPEGEGWTVRTNEHDGESIVRALLSKEYLVIDNDTMIEWLNDILTRDTSIPHRISTRAFVNVDNMNIDVMFKDIDTGLGNGNDKWEIGVRIRNGEIGDWKGGVYSVVKRGSCDNSIAVDLSKYSYEFRHAGHKTFELKKLMLKAAMLEILPLATEVIEKQIAAEEIALPSFADVVGGLAIKHGWSDDFKGAVFAGSEARYSVAGLVNGITYAAHTATKTHEDRVEMEFLGGKVLFDDRGALVREAEHLYNSREARKAYAEAK